MDERTTAWFDLHVASIDDDQRRITGIATTPEPDRRGDIIDPLGATYAAEIPLLLFHDKERPVGVAQLGSATPAGIPFTAWLKPVADPPALRDRIAEAWSSIKAGLLKGVSIGYRSQPEWMTPLKSGGFLFRQSEICELSLVTVPANPAAGITGIKAIDLAASGLPPAAVAAVAVPTPMQTQTLSEQITHWQSLRAPLVQKMTELVTDRTTTLNETEQKTYDGYAEKVGAIDGTLARLAVLDRANQAAATPISATPAAPTMRQASIQVRSAELPPGSLFVRTAMCVARAKGSADLALQYARAFESTPEVELMVKAAVAPGTTTDPAWAGVLVTVQNATAEFIELLRPATILGRLRGLRDVPFNTNVPSQTAGGSYGWVGQAAPKPVTKLAFGTQNLPIAKAAGIIVITEELARLSTPKAETLVRKDMVDGIAQFLDHQLIDPAIAAVANISPASLTNGVAPIAATTNALADLHAILVAFAADNIPLGSINIIMSETNAFSLGWVRDANGNRVFPGLSVNGGSAEGFNVITSNTAGDMVIGVATPLVLLADDGGVTIDVSREATIQMSDAPDNPAVPATTVFTSLWQNNLVGLRAERWINWLRLTPKAVHWVDGAAYAPMSVTPTGGATAAAPAKNNKH